MSVLPFIDVLIYRFEDEKLVLYAKDKTNERGEATFFLPAGEYKVVLMKDNEELISKKIKLTRNMLLFINAPLYKILEISLMSSYFVYSPPFTLTRPEIKPWEIHEPFNIVHCQIGEEVSITIVNKL